MAALESIVPPPGLNFVEKPWQRTPRAPLHMDWTGHTDWSAARAETPRSRGVSRGMAAMGELHICLQQYSAIERELQEPYSSLVARFDRGSPTISDFSTSGRPSSRNASRGPTPDASPLTPLAGFPPRAKSPARKAANVPRWDEKLHKKKELLDKKSEESKLKLKTNNILRDVDSPRSPYSAR
jgi:hypothetical protein